MGMRQASKETGVKRRRSIKWQILGSTALAVLVLVLVSAAIMVYSTTNLTRTILLDSLQPMAREAAKTVEGNLHLLADRTMAIALDSRLTNPEADEEARMQALIQARGQYEFITLGLYNAEGKLLLADGKAVDSIAGDPIFALLKETGNLTVGDPENIEGQMGIMMGMPVKQGEDTAFYLVGGYKYDALADVIGGISVGKSGQAIIINQDGVVVAHPSADFVGGGSNVYEMDTGKTATSIYDRMISGETGSATGEVNGQQAFVAFSPVRGTRWSLAIQVPVKDYMYLAYQAIAQIFAVAMVMLILALLVVYRLSRKISLSLGHATKRIEGLAEGDLRSEVQVSESRDELEVLSKSLKSTVTSVNRYLTEIQDVLAHLAKGELNVQTSDDFRGDFVVVHDSLSHIITSLNGTMQEINGATVRLSHTAETLSGQSGQLHHASLRQSDSVVQLVSEVENIKGNVDAVLENTEETKRRMVAISETIQSGTAHMDDMLKAMDAISKNAGDISKVSKMIEDIAMQTNILALNASVEAARAGSAGKGFAVVADEVRSLASKSAGAAQSTTAMIDKSVQIIQAGVNLAGETSASLEQIAKESAAISAITDRLCESVETQKRSLEEVTQQMEEISNVTGQNLQSAESTAAASGELSTEAERLREMVGRFTLQDEEAAQ